MSDTPASPAVPVSAPTGDRPTLDVRFVTRMSRQLCEAVSAAARGDGLSSGAWVRRLLMERVGVNSEIDARSGRPVHLPREEVAAISDAVRELASVNAAIALSDSPAARAGLDRARRLLLPVLLRQTGR